jgi:hypothetical protein
MNRKKFNQIKSKKLFFGVKKPVNGKNCTLKMRTLGILGTSNDRH